MSYPNTIGGFWTDYYISDKYIVETAEHEKSFTERVKKLSRCCWTYDTEGRTFDFSVTRENAGLPKNAVVLGNFNGSHKMSHLTLTMWMEILQRTTNTVLYSMESNHYMTMAMAKLADQYGVDPKRIIPAQSIQHAKHLGRFAIVDLVLDTTPCTGHTLSMDSLWGGCPLVTYAGNTPVARVGASAVRTLGFDNLVASSPMDYVNKAVELCWNNDLRHELRTQTLDRRMTGGLFDQKSFVTELDAMYLEIWDESKKRMGI